MDFDIVEYILKGNLIDRGVLDAEVPESSVSLDLSYGFEFSDSLVNERLSEPVVDQVLLALLAGACQIIGLSGLFKAFFPFWGRPFATSEVSNIEDVNKKPNNDTLSFLSSICCTLAICLVIWHGNAKLLGKETLQRSKAACSDGEEKQYGPLMILSQEQDSPGY